MKETEVIDILVIDDHPIVLDGIRTMLKEESQFKIVATAKNAAEALSYLAQHAPHIILLDISLPDMDGLQLCQKIRVNNKTSKILGLTSFNEAGMISSLLKMGGNGYLLKNMERSELIRAMHAVLGGKIFLSEAANESILAQFQNQKADADDGPLLTRREKEILTMLADGLKGPEIAEKLFLSPLTVETHRKNLCKKLNANSVQMLLKVARERKLIS